MELLQEKPPPNKVFRFYGALARLMLANDPEVLVEGPAGTGKTVACLGKCVATAENNPGCRVLIARATRVSMTQSVLVTLERDYLTESHYSRQATNVRRPGRTNYQFANGSEIVVAGLDDTQRVMSAEYDLVYVAEATEITEEDWERLLTRLRNGKTDFQQAICDCNPTAPGHWLNQRALRGGMLRLCSRHADNPNISDEYLRTLSQLTGHRRARLFEGRWVAGDGTVFPEFDVSRHVIQPFSVPIDWPHYVGVDPGYDHPCAILWVAVAPNGTQYVVDELYRGGLSIQQHAKDIHARNAGRTVLRYYADPQHAFSSTAQSPRSISAQFKDAGLMFIPWPRSTHKESMVNSVRERLIGDRLRVFSTCANTIREFQSWSYKRVRGDTLPTGDDQYEDKDNHSMDVLCGLGACNLSFSRQSVRVDLNNRV